MRLKLLGAVFLALVVASVYLTYAVFTKQFATYDEVTVTTTKVGLQLPERADVKIRGVIVGEVIDRRAVNDDGDAELTLGLFPDQRGTIPADVTARILPKTLFGEKYVALQIPEDPSEEAIEPGARITQTRVSIEVEKVLADLYPLLQTLQPVQLNNTLTAVSTALEGRGEELGENLETLDGYLQRMNPQIPLLVDDLTLAARTSDVYRDILPEVAQILRDQIVTTGTLEGREAKLRALFADVSTFSDFTRGFLARNESELVQVGRLSVPQLQTLAKYSPEFPCLAGGIVGAGAKQAEAFRGFTLHINLELIPNQPRRYTEADKPRYGENRDPYCGTLPNSPYNQQNPFDQPAFDDGVDSPTGKGTERVAPGFGRQVVDPGQYVGSPAEAGLFKTLLAPVLGVSEQDVPDLGVLLVGPMARGAEVSLR
ncbi:MCE family protein [Nocardioides sp. SOB77]|uniref:MCE family protein n=1 Tax=Nocardioides oceani TaxID=3058369 RepID=A0ABT8FAI9_9ACTN|nr:MCE family protein [Nocardioides oceani]MDN4171653.1 MCE family protein [Nocardioides oceani]